MNGLRDYRSSWGVYILNKEAEMYSTSENIDITHYFAYLNIFASSDFFLVHILISSQ